MKVKQGIQLLLILLTHRLCLEVIDRAGCDSAPPDTAPPPLERDIVLASTREQRVSLTALVLSAMIWPLEHSREVEQHSFEHEALSLTFSQASRIFLLISPTSHLVS